MSNWGNRKLWSCSLTVNAGLSPLGPHLRIAHRLYPVRRHARSRRYDITGRGFIKYYGIDTTTTRSYIPQLEDGMLVICLQEEQAKWTDSAQSTGLSVD
jgi:hypothetical protein